MEIKNVWDAMDTRLVKGGDRWKIMERIFGKLGDDGRPEYYGLRKAVVIGFKDPKDEKIGKVCRHSAQRVAELLGQQFEVRLIDDDLSIQQRQANRHDKYSVRAGKAIQQMLESSRETDTLLIYYSGHGEVIWQNGHPDLWLCMAPDDRYNVTDILDMARSRQYKYRNLVLILDCCYSGSVGGANGIFRQMPRGMCILTAGLPDTKVYAISQDPCVGTLQSYWSIHEQQVALDLSMYRQRFTQDKDIEGELRPLQHGYTVFSHLFIEAMCGGAANPVGLITLSGVYQYISEALGSNHNGLTRTEEGHHPISHTRPMMKSNLENDIPLCYVNGQLTDLDVRNLMDFRSSMPDMKYPLPEDMKNDQERLRLRSQAIKAPYPFLTGKTAEVSLSRLKKLRLIEYMGKNYLIGSENRLVDVYRLTPRGWHYWEMLDRFLNGHDEIAETAETYE